MPNYLISLISKPSEPPGRPLVRKVQPVIFTKLNQWGKTHLFPTLFQATRGGALINRGVICAIELTTGEEHQFNVALALTKYLRTILVAVKY